ncbi:hypothetical protein [Ligilactobacillus cholophilus]|uniref:hypothetical protein n=1 Tax=Ligilactobacillus cholophilus TaxID=3050131 RepID=UPI0025AFC5FE|nr:hypothetical protein [Ligilactobacillus cholophilus]
MEYIGVLLYVLWLLITMFKFGSLPRNRSFSYMSAVFGKIKWYHNVRTLLLLISIAITVWYAPLKVVYLLIFISAFILGITGIKNFFRCIGNPWVDLGIFLSCFICTFLSGTFIIKL